MQKDPTKCQKSRRFLKKQKRNPILNPKQSIIFNLLKFHQKMLRFTRALINLSPRISPRYFCTANDPAVESLDPSIFFDRPKLKSIN